ncbi:MAG TPA: response regulator transcription factor [Flavobacteriaceae bacterium]|nr:response regulator transcription factor [Flavobacteriaceae bacterium]MCB9213472.1 response regulator transcription factor [Alteromonas sp.]HPF12225.1 response regulator transcription factor [Flavobacteriaceae bacterium]HQU21988.1 response regulator transcription factor [Flavobacteriaceae bacterium]HQU65887.1 response regulator transcription factor [Flavobacteriaceae bacterium]
MDNANYTLLLVEDDPTLGYLLKEYLSMNHFNLFLAKTAKEALSLLENHYFDLAILDVMLPDRNGFDLAKTIQNQHPYIPFIFLTARSLKVDVLKGFSLGAVDYLKKPIDEEELVVRINSLLSRLQTKGPQTNETQKFSIGLYQFDSKNQQLEHRDGSITTLTKRESELLKYLMLHKNNLCTHKEILNNLWGKSDYFNKKSLNVFISHLRKYLQDDAAIKIENVHKQGFILRIP